MQIESLSPSPAKAVQELSDYDWRSPEARQKYEQIKDLLGREMLDQRFAGMKQALENATDEDRQAVNEMLDDLNDLLDKHSRGEDTHGGFRGLHGQARPALPGEPAQRRRTAGLAGPAGGGGAAVPQQPVRRAARRTGCAGAAGIRLAAADGGARAGWTRTCRRPGRGRTGTAPRSSPATTRWAWARAPRRWPTSPNSSNSPSSCRRATRAPPWTTSTSRRWPASSATRPPSTPARWPSLERALMNQGFLDRGSDGQWRLSPKAMRQLGQAALRDVAQQLSGRHGERETRRAGAAGELTGATRPWAFGDTEPWNVTRTMTNAVLRRRRRTEHGDGADPDRRRRRRGVRDRDPHPGGGRAAGRHLVLDGDGEPLAADEAHRAGAATSWSAPGSAPMPCRSSPSAATPAP